MENNAARAATRNPRGGTVRKWQLFPGKNNFCCDGRIVMGASPWMFYFTCVLIIVASGLFFGVDCPYLSVELSPVIPVFGALLFIFVMATLLRTAWSDPGIIPRATAQEAADTEQQIESTNVGGNELYPPPRVREVRINGVVIKLKFCPTCRFFRPPRAVHCSMCDNCVDHFDHHCPWVGNCVGRRNYRYFYIFLVAISVDCIYVCGCCVATIVMRSLDSNFMTALKQSPTSVLVAVVAFFSLWSVIGLAGFHTFLAVCNLTTNEDIKNVYSRSSHQKNPFSRSSLCLNFCHVICGPSYPRRGVVPRDNAVVVNQSTNQPSNGRQNSAAGVFV